MTQPNTTTDISNAVLSALQAHNLKPEKTKRGYYRSNCPWRNGSDSMSFEICVDPAWGGGGWYNYYAGDEKGNFLELAQKLNISLNGASHLAPNTKHAYTNLADYEAAHYAPGAFTAANWRETTYQDRPALAFDTHNGTRYRFIDGKEPTYKSVAGYTPCWYGLDRAVKIAQTTNQALIICNGEPSVIAAQYHDVAACAITSGERGAIPDHLLQELRSAWNGTIILALDCDSTGRKAATLLTQQLSAAEYDVRAVDLRGGKGFDLADFCGLYQKDSTSQLRRLATFERTKKKIDYVVGDWRKLGITLSELQYKYFDPERWIVEDILPEGACLLAAKYKSKKSWMSLALGIAIAMGGKALGHKEVTKGRVLYLDLEGKQQRIQKRTQAILGIKNNQWPDNFHVFTKWPQGEEGMAQLRQWFIEYPDTVLVVIDVLSDFRRPIEKHEQPYQYDRATVQPINELLEEFHAAGLLVHHFNKAKNDDIMDGISGTTGLPSAVNTMWGLSRDVNDNHITVLHLRGRDLENEEPIALRWDDYLCLHVLEGPAAIVATSTERKAILAVLSDDQPRSPAEIAKELGKTTDSIKQLLRKLLADRAIDKAGYGKYAIVQYKVDHGDHFGNGDHSDHSDHSVAKDVQEDREIEVNAQTLHKSDRLIPRVIPPDHSCLEHQEASNGKSDRSDRDHIKQPTTNVDWDFVRIIVKAGGENRDHTLRNHCATHYLDGVYPAPLERVLELATAMIESDLAP